MSYSILPTIDTKRYNSIPDMKGPIMTRSGKVLYYDNQVGKYYDRDSDIFIELEEKEAYDA